MKKIKELSPHVLLAAVFMLCMMPFALVGVFPSWFHHTVNVASYLVFHNISEFFSIIVSLSIFGVGWFTYDQSKNRHALFLSCAFLVIGLVDFMHALSFPGMPDFITPSSTAKGIQFWLFVRLFSACAFLASAFIYADTGGRWISKKTLLPASLIYTAIVFVSVIYYPDRLPTVFIEGTGLTQFKIAAEYIINGIFALAFVAYWRRLSKTGDRVLIFYLAAFILCIFSEMAFTLYKSAFDSYNLLGHAYKVAAFLLIYQGIFTVSVKHPYLEVVSRSEELRTEVDKRKKADELLIKSEERFRMLAENARDMIYRMSLPDGRYEYVSPASTDLFGYTPEEFYDSPILIQKVIHPDWRGYFEEEWAKLLAGNMSPLYEYQIVNKSGETRWLDQRNTLIRGDDGKPIAIQGIVTDITERKQAEVELASINRALRMLSEINQALIRITDETELLNEACRIAVEIGGYRMAWVAYAERDEAKTLRPVAHAGVESGYIAAAKPTWADNERGREPGGTAIRTGKLSLARNIQTDPVFAPWREEAQRRGYQAVIALPLVSEGRAFGVLGIYASERDAFDDKETEILNELASDLSFGITAGRTRAERIRAEQQLEMQHSLLMAIMNSSRDTIIFSLDRNYCYTTFNKRHLEEMKKVWDVDIKIGMNMLECVKIPESRELAKQSIDRALQGEVFTEVQHQPEPDIYYEFFWNPVIQNGSIVGVTVFIHDITERRRLEQQLIESQKMESIGRLAGGVAHDFNNFLTAIRGYIDLAGLETPPDSPAGEDLIEARAASDRAANLARQLLLFGRRESMELETVHLNQVVSDLLKMLTRLIGEQYHLKTDLAEDLWVIHADPGHLEQVLMNLVVNARDAMPRGGTIELSTRNVNFDPEFVKTKTGKAASRLVELSVTDSGTGMDAETLSHIFEPFFSTKGAGGTGLGLSVVYGIITQHGGWIDVESELGQGSTFRVLFPAIEVAAAPGRVEETTENLIRGRGERILLVEDDADIRKMAKKILMDNGYEVTPAADAESAMEAFDQEEGRFDLIFTDVVLPGKDGVWLVEQLHGRDPELPVLLASGYSGTQTLGAIGDLGYPMLRKPYPLLKLLREINNSIRR